MINHSNANYVSPLSGEFVPSKSVDELAKQLHEINDNRTKVTGPDVIAASPPDETPIKRLDMLPQHGITMSLHPQTLTISQEATQTLESMMSSWFSHYPLEPTYAQTAHNVPMLLTRFDGIIRPEGEIGLCEFDDVPTAFGVLRRVNPVAASYVDAVVARAGAPVYSAFLPEPGYIYPHDDDQWLPPTLNATPGTAVIPRVRRANPGFADFMDKFSELSIVAGHQRDHKGPLIAMGMGVLAANTSVALDVAAMVRQDMPTMIKGLRSSRTEASGAVAANKHKIRGASSPQQLQRKFEQAGVLLNDDSHPMVVQPFYRPPSMQELGLVFRPGDSETLAGLNLRGSTAHQKAVPGQEHDYSVLSRVYGVYLPGETKKQPGRHVIIGGFWMARPNAATIHGASDSIVGILKIEGLKKYDNV